MKRFIWVLALAAGCSGESVSEPSVCDARYACSVEGIDLALLDIRQVGDPAIDGVNIEFVIVNRGDRPSIGSYDVAVSIAEMDTVVRMGALEPGDSIVATANVPMQRPYLYHPEVTPVSVNVKIRTNDADPTNNEMNETGLKLPIPIVRLEVRLDSMQRVRVGQFANVVSRVTTNPSELRSAVSELFCLRRDNLTCTSGSWQALARNDQNTTFLSSRPFPIQLTGLGNPPTGVYEILVCVVPRLHQGMRVDLTNPDHHCEPGGHVNVLP